MVTEAESKPLLQSDPRGPDPGGFEEFAWSNLRYQVRGGRKGPLVLLDGTVSGSVRRGEVVAVMGPSGSSKTTLLSVLSGQWRGHQGAGASLAGLIEADGTPLHHALHRLRGVYVMQEAHLQPFLTVRETLTFAARLRCRSGDRGAVVARLLRVFNLERVAGTWCSKLSGGEKKRVYLASHLVHSPDLVILDEPTTGLDAENAAVLLGCLRTMAEAERQAVIITIHQPSSVIMTQLSKAVVMADGGMVYYGDAGGIRGFMEEAGWPVPAGWAPVEWIMHIIVSGPPQATKDTEAQRALVRSQSMDTPERRGAVGVLKKHCAKWLEQAPSPLHETRSQGSSTGTARASYEVGLVRQVLVLSHVALLSMQRDVSANLGPLVISNVMFGIVAATLWSRLDDSRTDYSLTMVLMLMVLNAGLQAVGLGVAFGNSSFAHFAIQRDAAVHRTSAWLAAHVVVHMPLVVFSQGLLLGLSYHFLHLKQSAEALAYLLAMLCVLYALLSTFAKAVGVLFRDLGLAYTMANVCQSVWVIFSGVFVMYPDMPAYWRWAYWTSPYSYALSGAIVNNFRGSVEGWAHVHFMGVQITNRWTHLIILSSALAAALAALYCVLRCKKLKYR